MTKTRTMLVGIKIHPVSSTVGLANFHLTLLAKPDLENIRLKSILYKEAYTKQCNVRDVMMCVISFYLVTNMSSLLPGSPLVICVVSMTSALDSYGEIGK